MSKASRRTASNLLRSWLLDAGAEVEEDPKRGTLKVNGSTEVAVVGEDCPAPLSWPNMGFVSVRAEDLAGDPERRAAAFHLVTVAAGMGKPPVPERGEGPAPKASYHEDEFLVVLRHTEFRRAPDPTPEQRALYFPIAVRSARFFHRMNTDFCRLAGLDREDLETIARCWAVNFAGLHERRGGDPDENARLFTSYAQQRFAELFRIYGKKMQSVAPDADTFSVALFGEPFRRRGGNFFRKSKREDEGGGPDPGTYFFDPREEREEVPVSEAGEEDPARRRAAAKSLSEKLAEMGPKALDALEGVVFSPAAFDPGAVDEARRRWTRTLAALPPAAAAERLRTYAAMPAAEGTARLEAIAEGAAHPSWMRQAARRILECRGASGPSPERSRLLPQANSLALLRSVVAAVGRGKVDSFELSEECGCGTRDSAYYRRAAASLGLLDGDAVTALGQRLLRSTEGSVDEASLYRLALASSPALGPISWFFDDPARPPRELAKFLVFEFGVAESTAERRACTFTAWRKRLTAATPAAA